MRRAAIAAALSIWPQASWPADFLAHPETYRTMIGQLQAGDRLQLAPGVYRAGLPLHGLTGEANRPITIEAADPGARPRFVARPGHNTVSLVDVRHLIVRDLELDGDNVAVDALKAEGHSRYADHVTLERLYIHDHAASQQHVGISTKCPALGWIIRDVRIERVGTGLYLGDSDGRAAFVGGLIEGNHVSQTLGYNLQIKHQIARPSGIAGRHDTVIRFNVFSKHGSRPGPLARPNVLLGHGPLSGAGADDRFLVYGNLMLDNPTEALVQAEGRVALYDNVLLNAAGDALHIQPHNDAPRDIDIFSNTVLAAGAGIRVRRGASNAYRQLVIGNLVAARTSLQGGDARDNVVLPYHAAWLESPLAELAPRMLAGRAALPTQRSSDARRFARYPGWSPRARPGARIDPALLRTLELPHR